MKWRIHMWAPIIERVERALNVGDKAPIIERVERALNVGDNYLCSFNLNKAHFTFFDILRICDIYPFRTYAPSFAIRRFS
jgi:hypothetical protein